MARTSSLTAPKNFSQVNNLGRTQSEGGRFDLEEIQDQDQDQDQEEEEEE